MPRLSRVVYADDPVLVLGRSGAERAYGGRLLIVPTGISPPPRPREVRGTVVHLDPLEDPHWIRGQDNPMLEWAAVKARIGAHFPGVGDVDDKWHEYRFLAAAAPEVAPPRTALAGDFALEPASDEELAAAQAAIAPTLAQGTGLVPAEDLVRLEVMRTRIHAALGPALLKGRVACTSEGVLPATTDDWAAEYLRYVARTRAKIERVKLEVEGSSATLESRIQGLPHVKGRLLEELLMDPERVVAQALVAIDKELRLHVVQGKVLAGATFLRSYPKGVYLRAQEVERVQKALERYLLDRLPPDLARFSCSCDVILSGESISIIDLNAGLESGYYFPEEDIFTTNLLAAHFLGAPTPFLQDFRIVMAGAPGHERAARLKRLLTWMAPIMHGDVQEAFWDRVLPYHAAAIREQPDAAALTAALSELAAAGLTRRSIFEQLIAWAQDTWPSLTAPRYPIPGAAK